MPWDRVFDYQPSITVAESQLKEFAVFVLRHNLRIHHHSTAQAGMSADRFALQTTGHFCSSGGQGLKEPTVIPTADGGRIHRDSIVRAVPICLHATPSLFITPAGWTVARLPGQNASCKHCAMAFNSPATCINGIGGNKAHAIRQSARERRLFLSPQGSIQLILPRKISSNEKERHSIQQLP